MNRLRLESLATLVLLLDGTGLTRPASAQVTQDKSGGYVFRVKYVKGMKLTYEMRAHAAVTGLNSQQAQLFNGKNQFDETQTTVSEVLEVKNGVATIRNTRNASEKSKGGQKDYTYTEKVDARGRRVDSPGQGSFGLIDLPDRPLKAGESFNSSPHDLFQGSSGKPVPSDCKFLGIKTVGNRKVAQFNLHLKFNANGDNINGLASGYLLIDMADGQLHTVHYTINGKADFSKEKNKSGVAGPSNVGLTSEVTIIRK